MSKKRHQWELELARKQNEMRIRPKLPEHLTIRPAPVFIESSDKVLAMLFPDGIDFQKPLFAQILHKGL